MTTQNSGKIGMVGLAGSGKTTFLSMLPRVISPPWYVNYHGNTQDLIREASRFLSKGIYPVPTYSSKFDEYSFTIKKEPEHLFFRNRSPIEMTVTLNDIAGEHYDFDSEIRMTDQELFDQHLYQCQGILFLIDPRHEWTRHNEENRNRYFFLFQDILNSLNNRYANSDLYVAFCITKFDYFLEKSPDVFLRCIPGSGATQLELSNKDVQENLIKCADRLIFGDHGNTVGEIEKFSSRSRNHTQWFACSATGWMEVDKEEFERLPIYYKNLDESLTNDSKGFLSKRGKKLFPRFYKEGEEAKIYKINDLRPYGLAEPLFWLFTEISKKN